MDKIFIDKLEIFANHGALEAEKALVQKFVVSLELCLDLRNAGINDDLSQTVNYAEVCAGVNKIMQKETYDLIETCAEKIAAYVLRSYSRVNAVSVRVEKPWAPVEHCANGISVQISRKWSRVYLGLGSNIGDTKAALDSAIEKMSCNELKVIQCSSYYKTKPVSHIPQDDYLNCVLEAKTTFSPHELISHLLQVESSLGRERSVPLGPRTIDIDVLTYDNMISDDKEITLPHPRMQDRLFVLVPFCELNPYFVHPLLKMRVVDLKDRLEETQEM